MNSRTARVQQTAGKDPARSHRRHLSTVLALVTFAAGVSLGAGPDMSRGAPAHATPTTRGAHPTPHSPPGVRATMSHYATCTYVNAATGCDGYLGQRTACGRIVTTRSRFVAALTRSVAHCGMHLTITYRGRRYHVTVQDTGAYRTDHRDLDAAPGLRRAMGSFDGVAHIRYRKGWH